MLVLVVIVLLLAGVSRACAFSPTGPSVDPAAVPSVDAPAELRTAAKAVDFPIRVPAVPTGWRANSASRGIVEGAGVVRVGWLTPAGHYLRLAQSPAEEGALVAAETGGAPNGRGTADVGGLRWVVYQGGNGEPASVADLGGVRQLITGSGSDEEFRALAGATAAGQVLPTGAG